MVFDLRNEQLDMDNIVQRVGKAPHARVLLTEAQHAEAYNWLLRQQVLRQQGDSGPIPKGAGWRGITFEVA